MPRIVWNCGWASFRHRKGRDQSQTSVFKTWAYISALYLKGSTDVNRKEHNFETFQFYVGYWWREKLQATNFIFLGSPSDTSYQALFWNCELLCPNSKARNGESYGVLCRNCKYMVSFKHCLRPRKSSWLYKKTWSNCRIPGPPFEDRGVLQWTLLLFNKWIGRVFCKEKGSRKRCGSIVVVMLIFYSIFLIFFALLVILTDRAFQWQAFIKKTVDWEWNPDNLPPRQLALDYSPPNQRQLAPNLQTISPQLYIVSQR